jgi:uncharacterized protein YutE (UPF0331/DUF86 family)
MNEKQIKTVDVLQMASNLNAEYIFFFHEYVRDKLEDKESELSELIKSFSGARSEKVGLLDEHETFSKIFPRQLSSNTFLFLYSHLEEFIHHISNIYCPTIDIGKKKIGSISRYKPIFKHLFNNDLSNCRNWEFINDCEKLRNCILHANGRIDLFTPTSEIERIITKHPDLITVYKKRVIIEYEFVSLFWMKIQETIKQIETL